MKSVAVLSALALIAGTALWINQNSKESSFEESIVSRKSTLSSQRPAKYTTLDSPSGAETPFIKPTTPQAARIARPYANLDKQVLLRSGGIVAEETSPTPLVEALSLSKNDMTVRQRVDVLEALEVAPSPEEMEAMLEFVTAQQQPEGMRTGSYHWLVDETITALRHHNYPVADLTNSLVKISGEATQDPVLRDYALQHLGHLVEEGGDESVIRAALNTALSERQGTIAGTALLVLQHWSGEENLAEKSEAIAADETMSPASRLTAEELIKLLSEE